MYKVTSRQISIPTLALLGACTLASCNGSFGDGDPAPQPDEKLLVAWTAADNAGWLGAMSVESPWQFDGAPLPIGGFATLRCANSELFVLSQADGTVSVIDRSTQTVQLVASLGAGEPMDIVVTDAGIAYITNRSATHLQRLDLETGTTTDVVDLSAFADDDGIPDLGMMAVHGGRVIAQIRRANTDADFGFASPPYLAVIDLASEQLVDTEPGIPGIQAIELLGTAPKHKMQVISSTAELFVSASGAIHDQGGIEVIDLGSLRSKGLVISEAIDAVGADVGPFIMVTATEGFLVTSTDLDGSSHLQRFTVDGGVDPPPDLAQSIGYHAPSLAMDSRRETLFFPSGQFEKMGVLVLGVSSGDLLKPTPTNTDGPPSDVLHECSRA
jgi:hypothetical protein